MMDVHCPSLQPCRVIGAKHSQSALSSTSDTININIQTFSTCRCCITHKSRLLMTKWCHKGRTHRGRYIASKGLQLVPQQSVIQTTSLIMLCVEEAMGRYLPGRLLHPFDHDPTMNQRIVRWIIDDP